MKQQYSFTKKPLVVCISRAVFEDIDTYQLSGVPVIYSFRFKRKTQTTVDEKVTSFSQEQNAIKRLMRFMALVCLCV